MSNLMKLYITQLLDIKLCSYICINYKNKVIYNRHIVLNKHNSTKI